MKAASIIFILAVDLSFSQEFIKLPDWPTDSDDFYIRNESSLTPSGCQGRVYQLYKKWMPYNCANYVDLIVIPRPPDVDPTCLGMTRIKTHSLTEDNVQRLGATRTTMVVEVYNKDDYDTMHHELSHAYNIGIQSFNGHELLQNHQFMEEGQAVLVQWLLNPGYSSYFAVKGCEKNLVGITGATEWGIYCSQKMRSVPGAGDYPLAGFIALCVRNKAGIDGLRGMSGAKDYDACIRELRTALRINGYTEDDFWKYSYSLAIQYSEWDDKAALGAAEKKAKDNRDVNQKARDDALLERYGLKLRRINGTEF